MEQPTLSLASPKSLIKRKHADGALQSESTENKKAATGERNGE